MRLSDKLEGDEFTDADRASAEKFVSFGSTAVANALRFRALERLSFRDPATKAYSHAYFDDVVRNEIQKASRFGRHFSIARVDCGALGKLDEVLLAERSAGLGRNVRQQPVGSVADDRSAGRGRREPLQHAAAGDRLDRRRDPQATRQPRQWSRAARSMSFGGSA